jgi:aerobic carbon-monoxide dehydrogenase medium subunit
MIPPSFDYHVPTNLSDAIGMLQQYGSEAKILSGGMSLIPLMKLRLASPAYLIDINRISGLDHIKESDGFLRIGALAREADLEKSEMIRNKYPLLLDTTLVIADPLVRNRATVGGNLAHGDPANDHPATMLALEAEIVAVGPQGERKIPVASFFTDLFTTALRSGEILTEIRIPIPPPGSGGAYFKLERKVGDFATAGVAAQLTVGEGDICERAGIGLTNVGLTPVKARRAEEALQGKKIDRESIKRVAQLASQESEPTADLRGSEEYKRDLIRVLAVRTLNRALERSRGRSSHGEAKDPD